MKRTLIITTLLVFFLALAGVFTFAQPERENRRDNNRQKMHEKLNLTDEQQTQIEKLRFTHQEKMIDLKADVEKKELGLKELQSIANFSRGDYIAKVEEIISSKNKIQLEKANHHMDVYELLDTEQKETWNKMKPMKDRKHDKMKKHFKKNNRF
jgi:Spy/CpxP family protein refolding chaperone